MPEKTNRLRQRSLLDLHVLPNKMQTVREPITENDRATAEHVYRVKSVSDRYTLLAHAGFFTSIMLTVATFPSSPADSTTNREEFQTVAGR